VGQSTHSFPYEDVAAVSPRAAATQMRVGHRVTRLDGGFAISLVDGDTVEASTGLTDNVRRGEVAWPNAHAFDVVERQVRAQLGRG